MRVIAFVGVWLALFTPMAKSQNRLATENKCVLIYALDGSAYDIFQSQINALTTHLKQRNIALVDLNHWQQDKRHLNISGRQRALLRGYYDIPRDQPMAVVVSNEGKLLTRSKTSVELVELILGCH